MKGIWTWPTEPKEQQKTLRMIERDEELVRILSALQKNPHGLSNAQLDRLLANNSQWRTLSHMNELIALKFVEYHVQFFGEAGVYELTDIGRTVMTRIRTNH